MCDFGNGLILTVMVVKMARVMVVVMLLLLLTLRIVLVVELLDYLLVTGMWGRKGMVVVGLVG